MDLMVVFGLIVGLAMMAYGICLVLYNIPWSAERRGIKNRLTLRQLYVLHATAPEKWVIMTRGYGLLLTSGVVCYYRDGYFKRRRDKDIVAAGLLSSSLCANDRGLCASHADYFKLGLVDTIKLNIELNRFLSCKERASELREQIELQQSITGDIQKFREKNQRELTEVLARMKESDKELSEILERMDNGDDENEDEFSILLRRPEEPRHKSARR